MGHVAQDVLVVIPARLESTRFPGKPLIEIAGKPLVWYAWHAASTWPRAASVMIASPDASILDVMASFGAEVHESPPDLRNGSQRAFEVFRQNPVYRVVVNLQCDEPEISHAMLDAVIEPLKDSWPYIATLSGVFPKEPRPYFSYPTADPNIVKVVVNADGRALYFTRQSIPASRCHIGMYAFSGEQIHRIAKCPVSISGQVERLEQLDWLAADWAIQVVPIDATPLSINTPADLELFRAKVEGRL